MASQLMARQQTNSLLAWSIRNRRLIAPDKPFNLRNHRWLVDIYNETAQRLIIKKAAQVGASEYLVSYALHGCDQRKATVIYVMPTDGDVSDFSQARFGPAMEASPYLNSIVVSGSRTGGSDKVTLKRVGNGFLYFRGGQVKKDGRARQLKSVPADILILDELDEIDRRAPVIARYRLGHSAIAEERAVSTPTYPGVGIDAEWLDSDQKLWHLKCDSCHQWQPLSIDNVVTRFDDLERPVEWHGKEDDRAFVACRKCGAELDRLGVGQWVATYPGRETAGYHISKLFSPMVSPLDIVQKLDTTDETKRREVFNQDLGETYTPKGGKLSDVILDDCRGDYAHGPIRTEQPVMGVDVGKVLHVVIRGPADEETDERPQRFAGEVESFAELGRLISKYRVKQVVIDALPETRKAREFQADFQPGVVWLAYYANQQLGLKKAEPVQWKIDEGTVNIDRTRLIDETFSRFYDGKNTLPGDASDIKDYYSHLKAPVRVLEDGPGGVKVAKYIESGPDHLAHAENYCTVASMDMPGNEPVTWGRG